MMLSQKESPLLDYAILRLRPGVFSHPVWVKFSDKNLTSLPETIKDLFGEVENLRYHNPSDACQVLLICAVYQNCSGQKTSALSTIQRAINLAENASLAQEILWATWGACAICAQQGNFGQAANHLLDLKGLLNKQNEWILADFIDIVRQTLVKQSGLPENRPAESLLIRAFELLNQWGCSAHTPIPDVGRKSILKNRQITSQTTLIQSLFAIHQLQGHWRNLMLMIRGEFKLHWDENETNHGIKQSSVWRSIASFFHLDIIHRKIDARMSDVDLAASLSRAPAGQISAITPVRMLGTVPTFKSINTNHLTGETTAVMPVSVQMLGNFSISFQDAALKLPALRSLSLLKYLMFHHKQNNPREILMDVFWPDASPEKARNNLNVAIHHIRQILRPMVNLPVIYYRDGLYGIAPNVQIWLDVEEFERLVSTGQRLESRNQLTEAVSDYETALSLYQGNFLEESPYEGWTALPREHLRLAYLDTLDHLSQIYYSQQSYTMCISLCQRLLTQDCCREDAHCMLMRCYNHIGQDHLALRQYQTCLNALRSELDTAPTPATTQLFEKIRQHKHVY